MNLKKRLKKMIKKNANIYSDNGYKNRKDYLQSISKHYNVSYIDVKNLALELGVQEDFYELINEIQKLENSNYNESELLQYDEKDVQIFGYENEEIKQEDKKDKIEEIVENNTDVIDLSEYEIVSSVQMGSNGGGIYENSDGNRVFVKTFVKNDDYNQLRAENEVLASALYQALGVNTVSMGFAERDNKMPSIYSPMIETMMSTSKSKIYDEDFVNKVREDFIIDAWLCNWDVAGLIFDNIMVDNNGNPLRVDPGGSIYFRAQGEPKGSKFGYDVPEIDTLRNKQMNPTSSAFFNSITDEQMIESAKKLLNISEEQIDYLVDSIIQSDKNAADEIKEKLKKRREYILNKFDI